MLRSLRQEKLHHAGKCLLLLTFLQLYRAEAAEHTWMTWHLGTRDAFLVRNQPCSSCEGEPSALALGFKAGPRLPSQGSVQ